MKDNRGSLNFSIRCAPNSIDEQLAMFFSENMPELKKERVLEALRAFWLSFALEHCDRINSEEIEKAAFRSVCLLEAQAAYIRKCFNLEPFGSERVIVERTHTPVGSTDRDREKTTDAEDMDIDEPFPSLSSDANSTPKNEFKQKKGNLFDEFGL